jgi:hypothetical protein
MKSRFGKTGSFNTGMSNGASAIFVCRYETPAKAQQENRQTATAGRQNRLFISFSAP